MLEDMTTTMKATKERGRRRATILFSKVKGALDQDEDYYVIASVVVAAVARNSLYKMSFAQ